MIQDLFGLSGLSLSALVHIKDMEECFHVTVFLHACVH